MHLPAHTRYLCWLAVGWLACVGTVALFNLAVDPYGIWGTPSIDKLDAAKPAELDNEMMFKAADMRRHRPVTLLLGSSRIDLGLDPLHPALAARGPAYNLALMGGFLGAQLQYYRDALGRHPPPRYAVMGIDFLSFNRNVLVPASYDPARLGRDHPGVADIVASLFTRDAVADSVLTIRTSLRQPNFRAYTNGMNSDFRYRAGAATLGMPERMRTTTEHYLNSPALYQDFELSGQAFADFAQIVRLSRENSVDLQVFIPPEHVVLQEALRVRGLWDAWWAWKQRIAEVVPYWDFSGYNSITTEPIAPGMTQYWDASHFRKPVGDLVLDRMQGIDNPALPEDFGRYVDAGTVNQWRAETERGREAWAADHADVIRWVQARAVDR